MKNMQDLGAVEDFEAKDIDIKAGSSKDSVIITLGVKPTDTVDKIYMEVEVR